MYQSLTVGLCNVIQNYYKYILSGLPYSSDGEESACNATDPGLILGSERSPGEGNGNPLQNFCLENPMDRGAWQAAVYRVTKSQTQLKRLNTHAQHILKISAN